MIRPVHILLLLVTTLSHSPCILAGDNTSTAPIATTPLALDQNIDEIINRPEFSWRLPREAIEDSPKNGFLTAFLEEVGRLLKTIGHHLESILQKFGKWIEEWFRNDRDYEERSSSGRHWEWLPRILLIVLLVVVACVGGIGLMRMLKKYRRRNTTADSGLLFAPPDLKEDNVTADQLETSAWMELARELLDAGQLRLAARAMFLASLAHLAELHLLSIARFKSNREYERELMRKAHDRKDLLNTFSGSMYFFESIWYGVHTITPQKMTLYTKEVHRILDEN